MEGNGTLNKIPWAIPAGQYENYQQWLDNYNIQQFSDKIWPYRMAIVVQMIVQFILICMAFIIINPQKQ